MKKLYTSTLFAAVAAVALLGGCDKNKDCDKCCKGDAAATSADANADTTGGCCTKDAAKDGTAGEKTGCASSCSKDAKAAEGGCSKDANSAAGGCSKDAKSAEGACSKDANSAACGAKDGNACTKAKSECCGASKCAGTKN